MEGCETAENKVDSASHQGLRSASDESAVFAKVVSFANPCAQNASEECGSASSRVEDPSDAVCESVGSDELDAQMDKMTRIQEMHCFYVTKKYVQRFCNHLRANAEDEEGIVRYWKYTRLLKRRMHRIADMCWAGWKAYMYVSRSEATTKLYRQELREIAELGSVSESTRQESQIMKSDFSYRDK